MSSYSYREAENRIAAALREGWSEELDLSNLGLDTLPESLRELSHIRRLNLGDNHLYDLPEWLTIFYELDSLRLSGNSFSTLPWVVPQLHNLSVLTLSRNRFVDLPDLSSLRGLDTLHLRYAGLEVLPPSLSGLTNLRVLRIDGNRLRALPDWIGELTNLREIWLQDNRLEELPATLRKLDKLQALRLSGNAGLSLPPELLQPDTPAKPIVDYYFHAVFAARPLNEARLILVGRGGVGKTSLVDRLVNDRFQQQTITEGIEITDWPIRLNGSEEATLHIWDFGGQELMHSTHQFFLTERSLYLLVLSGRENKADVDVEYWLGLIDSFAGDSPVIVVLNKIREHGFDLNRGALLEKHPRIRHFVKTDCSDGTGIAELRSVVEQETTALPHLRDRFPAQWVSIKERLSRMPENYVSFEDYRRLCRELGETDEQAHETLAVVLHCLGIALNYRNDPRLRETNILNPHWVTNGIYKILNSERLNRARGELNLHELSDILDCAVYPQPKHEFLLNLMRKFELCFRYPEPRDDTYLVPELLGKEQPDLGTEFNPADCLHFFYTYPVWRESFLPRFIVRTHAQSAGEKRWRTGVVLLFKGNRALVRAEPQDKIIRILVTGPERGRPELLAIIRFEFERIHGDFPKLNPVAMVPLPDVPAFAISCEELEVYRSSGIKTVPRVIDGKVVSINVTRLLDRIELAAADKGNRAKVFISYSHKDEELRDQLETHLKVFQRNGLIETWHDREITGGEDWQQEIDRNIESADAILLLVSASFLASDYVWEREMKRALERHDAGEACVIPIIVRECQWKEAPFARLQVLPTKARPVKKWPDRDSAWSNVAAGIRKAISRN